MDDVHKEVRSIQTEHTTHLNLHNRIDERLDRIEKVPVIAHTIKS